MAGSCLFFANCIKKDMSSEGMLVVRVEWKDKELCGVFTHYLGDQPAFVQHLRAPRGLRYGGCDIPVGHLMQGKGEIVAEPLLASELHQHILQAGRMLGCAMLVGDHSSYPYFQSVSTPICPSTETVVEAASGEAAWQPPELHPLTQSDIPAIQVLSEVVQSSLNCTFARRPADWLEDLADGKWLGWHDTTGAIAGYVRLGADGAILETAASSDDYLPLLAWLGKRSDEAHLQLHYDHPLTRGLFRNGAKQIRRQSGQCAILLNLYKLMECIQRQMSSRLRESRFYNYSGELGLTVGNEYLSMRAIRGGIIDILHREAPKPEWPAFTVAGFLQVVFGQMRVLSAVQNTQASPQLLHILDIIFS